MAIAEGSKTVTRVSLIGQATYPGASVPVAGTLLGGLSGITYDAKNNRYYSISDDRGTPPDEPGQPPRFYTLNLDLSSGTFDNSKVSFTGVTTIKKPDGSNFAPLSTDTEAIALTNNDTVFISSEGDATTPGGSLRVAPFVNEFSLTTGQQVRALQIPQKFLPNSANPASPPTIGTRNNLAFESAAITPDQKLLFTATENALIQDGPSGTTSNGSRSRFIQFNLATGQAEKEFLYNTDPVALQPNPTTAFATSGLVDLFAIDNNGTFLALERSFSTGAPTTGNTGNNIKLYEVSIQGATDISSIDSLSSLSADKLAGIQPVKKRLLLDFDTLNLPTGLDNVEGVTFGPKLPDGRQSIVLVSDNNFAKSQFTQIIALAADVSFTNSFLNKATDSNTFTLEGGSGKPQLQVSFSGSNSNQVNELGVFIVDDTTGKIGNLAPGATGYTQAALARGKTIFSAISNTPNGFNQNQLSSLLEFSDPSNLRFYLVKNSTTDAVRANSSLLSNVLIADSTAQKVTTNADGSFSLGFRDGSSSSDNLAVKIQPITQTSLPLGINLQAQNQGEVFDLRSTTGNVKANFTVYREAAFNDIVGFYRVADSNGGIDINGDGKADITPGQAGYAQAAMNARVTDINLSVANQGTGTFNDKLLAGGNIYAPFLLTNGRSVEQVLAGQVDQAYFAYLGANSDKVDHVRLLGNNTFGFEDIAGGGDLDFNDVIVKATLTPVV